ncbi:molybdopterin molybdotransferase MoeA [Mycobacterium sp. CBMA271]|uniref:molybdopterin molybdotransferase MoeA n=1 Tax=unclassified Mycobacteroides TaxID=2618759 RepID=UPI0012DE236E|nr:MULTISPECIES: gephyrin-like molybdotransferase Glp [unclassified Mycobacteroides]MUM16990.1 molybdopterin molybdenumtransferase [Mycobacteroides sp. CBMA 326]MUM24022.1 molybdopterin molybdotransferase MoeA [Mycobacteroides sp. CBMA 271]
MRSVAEHQQVVAELIKAPAPVRIPVGAAERLVLATDVVAPLNLPVFDNSAMDGYAVVHTDLAGASPAHPVTLPVTEDIPAGRTDELTLKPGTAHRIMTGAPVPAGATAVVPVEATDGGTETVTITEEPRAGRHIRCAGEDVQAGVTVLAAGTRLKAPALGLAAALGLEELTVHPRLRVVIASTGSELVPPGTDLKPGQIYESNAIMLAAAVQEAGADAVVAPTVADDVEQFLSVLDEFGAQADLVITTGGVSAGAYEVVKDALTDAGVQFVSVAMQPGKPQGAGQVNGVPVLTLPGNPVSALVSFEVFIREPLRAAMGLNPARERHEAVLTEGISTPAGKRQFRRGCWDADKGTVTVVGPPASHHLRWLAASNCLLDIPEEVTELAAGTTVSVWNLT